MIADRVAHRGAAVIRPPRRVWFDVSYRRRDGDWAGSTICCPVEERDLFHEILGEWLDAFRWARTGDHRLKEDGLPETRLTLCPCECGVPEDEPLTGSEGFSVATGVDRTPGRIGPGGLARGRTPPGRSKTRRSWLGHPIDLSPRRYP